MFIHRIKSSVATRNHGVRSECDEHSKPEVLDGRLLVNVI